MRKQTTWFTKGLRPCPLMPEILLPYGRNKRPDLRRDCDVTWYSIIKEHCETNDLIYEGIATYKQSVVHEESFSRNKRPDLRRDCDKNCHVRISGIRRPKQTTWFTKGLRLLTSLACGWRQWKQTTWFTKGLRLFTVKRCDAFSFIETNDLIYEGIATSTDFVCNQMVIRGETNDLIYEGIATLSHRSFIITLTAKQTTWFTKGLRRFF